MFRIARLCFYAAATLACSACAQSATLDPHDTVWLSSSFSDVELSSAESAAHEWSVATRGRVALDLRVGDGEGARIEFGKPNAGKDATTYRDGKVTIEISEHAIRGPYVDSAALMRTTVLHELGHAFGLEHVAGGLMDPNGGTCVDTGTLMRFCLEWGCSKVAATTCL